MSNEKTWEEAAEATSKLLVLPDIRYDVRATSIYVLLDSVERHLDALRVGNVSPAAYERWRWIAELGVAGYTQLCERSDLADTIAHVHNTIVSKQHDYGHDNINWGGRQGLVIRTHDKVARIRNLMSRGVEDTKNEPLADSWLDLTGYGLIGMMFEEGSFNLPLAADVPSFEWKQHGVPAPFPKGTLIPDPSWAYADDGTPLPVMDAITPATALQWTPGPEVLAGLSQMQQSYDELLAPEVDTKPDGYEWLEESIDDEAPFAEYEYVIRSDSEHVDAGIVVQTFTETPTKAFVGGWNSILGGGPGDPHGMWLDRGQLVELGNALEIAFHALNR